MTKVKDGKTKLTISSAYLAGPMRGIDDWNIPAFTKAARWLREQGWSIFSPAERDEEDPNHEGVKAWASHGNSFDKAPYTFAEYMALDLPQVCSHEAIICLPGWEDSKGARLETMVAVEIGHPVFEVTGPQGMRIFRFGDSSKSWQLTSVNPDYVRDVFAIETLDIRAIHIGDMFDAFPKKEHNPMGLFTDDEGKILRPHPVQPILYEMGNNPLTPQESEAMRTFETGAKTDVKIESPHFPANDVMREFATGATRNVEKDPDYEGFLSPLAVHAYGQYMHEHRTQGDGTIRESDNWQKGIPFDSFIKSATRHLHDLQLIHDGFPELAREDIDSALSGLFFNIQGYLHFLIKERIEMQREA